jgi:hypothetical protein
MCSGGWREFSAKSLLVRLVRTSQVNSSLNQPVTALGAHTKTHAYILANTQDTEGGREGGGSERREKGERRMVMRDRGEEKREGHCVHRACMS